MDSKVVFLKEHCCLGFISSDVPEVVPVAGDVWLVRPLQTPDPASFIFVCRKSGLMSGPVLHPWPCGRVSGFCGILLLISSPLLTAGKKTRKSPVSRLFLPLCGTVLVAEVNFIEKQLFFFETLRFRCTLFFAVLIGACRVSGPAMILQMQTFRLARRGSGVFAAWANTSSSTRIFFSFLNKPNNV